ncbi:MAG: type II CRISPR RNA-guided endonuclease Cas9 [Desulfurivibrionaceae bacterium]|nr:MAG: type II CRISPR RNA-guided endonuclease Cas9 [Deltaproteobacteria bacterium HGW-Deltaproteobacteria-3]
MPKPDRYTLGLDIGMASVGAALLACDHIIALFVRTFDKAETAKEGESLNKIRRDARLTRRRIRRRAHRLLRLRRLFKRISLLPTNPNNNTLSADNLSPWQLRAEGLDRRLDPQEWAAVLYHLVKHRGFLSNRKSEAKTDAKTGEMLGGVSTNQQRLSEGGYRTIGEMAWKDDRFSAAKRNKGGDYSHTFARADLVNELRSLFSCQRKFENPHTNPEFETATHELLMARRPTLSGDNLLKMVGKCTFEPTEYRAPKASHTAERFVWLTKLNNLRISGIGVTRPLTDGERQTLIHLPFSQAKLTYKQVRTKLALGEADRFVGLDYRNSKDPELAALFEAKAFHLLRKVYESAGLHQAWQRDGHDRQRLDLLAHALTVFKDDNEARQWLTVQGVEAEIIEAVLEESFDKFIRLSLKALHKILPHMEAGLRYDEAVQAAGYSHHSQIHTDSKTRYIPKISKEDIANPVVSRALNQARRLVNAIVREYGSPMAVHIELARDLNKPYDERRRIEKDQKTYKETKDKDIVDFEKRFEFTPKGLELVKWRLYREQDAQCAYSQTGFDLNRLFEPGYAEIDHALPQSRSFDNGMNNKVLVHSKHNRDKGNRTPYEYLGGDHNSPEWQHFVAWVEGNKKYRLTKRQRLLRKDFGKEEANKFRERNLTDTRYASKKFKQLVETHLQLAEESDSKRCVVLSGQLTAYLRARWVLNKVREDGDLHHALDAAVVAACSHSMVKRLSDYSRRKELEQSRGHFVDYETGEVLDLAALRRVEAHFPQPWPGFRKELEARLSPDPAATLHTLAGVAPVRVSRAPTRRGLGAAHQETIRSAKCLEDGTSSVKTSLTSLKLKDLPRIVGYNDPRNRTLITAIEQRLREHDDNGAKAFKEPLRRPAAPGKKDQAPIVRSVNLRDTQKSGLLVRDGIANNGSMLRVDIFTKGGKFFAVLLYVADTVKTELPNRAVVASKPESEWPVMDDSYAFLFSLHPNDWIKVTLKDQPLKEGYFSGLDRSTGAVSIWAHDRNSSVGKDGLMRSIGIKTALSLEKCHVDILGRLHRVHQETRQPLRHK